MVVVGGIDSGVVHGVWRAGDRMVMAEDAEPPDRCVKTDQPADGEWAELRVRWHHPALYLVLLANLLLYFVVAYFASTTAVVHVGLKAEILAAARRARYLAFALLLVGLVCGVLALGWPAPWLWLPAIALTIAAALIYLLRCRLVWATRIEHGYVWLAGAHPDYLARLPQWTR